MLRWIICCCYYCCNHGFDDYFDADYCDNEALDGASLKLAVYEVIQCLQSQSKLLPETDAMYQEETQGDAQACQ